MNRKIVESRIKNKTNSQGLTYIFPDSKRTDVIDFEFEYLGNEKELLATKGSCGCTDVEIIGNKIKGRIRLAAAVSADNKDVQKSVSAAFGESLSEPTWIYQDENKKVAKLNSKSPIVINLTIKGKIID